MHLFNLERLLLQERGLRRGVFLCGHSPLSVGTRCRRTASPSCYPRALVFVTAELFCNGGPGAGHADDAAKIVFLRCWSRDRDAVGSGTLVRVKMRPRDLSGIALEHEPADA